MHFNEIIIFLTLLVGIPTIIHQLMEIRKVHTARKNKDNPLR